MKCNRRRRHIVAFRHLISGLLFTGLIFVTNCYAKGSTSGKHRSNYCTTCSRTASGRIKRSSTATNQFKAESGYKHGRPGYVIDHVVPLKNGGSDSPSNMQWQTIDAAKAKDKIE